jgi:uncharacterized protein
MKYLILFILVLCVIGWWRNLARGDNHNNEAQKRPTQKRPTQPRPNALPPTQIVACRVCDLHLPRRDALVGPAGLYCCEAHRKIGA